MYTGKIFYLLLQGFFLGYGPCLMTCAPILLPYVLSKKHWKEGLIATLEFSLARLLVYVILGGVAGYIGAFLVQFYFTTLFSFYIKGALAFVLILIGLLIMFGKGTQLGFCRIERGNMFLLGLLVGLSPCFPLVGILLEIALLSDSLIKGMIYSFAFSIGTIISPLLILGAIAPHVGTKVSQKLREGFVFVCGILIILMGLSVFSSIIWAMRV